MFSSAVNFRRLLVWEFSLLLTMFLLVSHQSARSTSTSFEIFKQMAWPINEVGSNCAEGSLVTAVGAVAATASVSAASAISSSLSLSASDAAIRPPSPGRGKAG